MLVTAYEGSVWKGGVHELEADVGQVEGLGGVGKVDCCVHAGLTRESSCLSKREDCIQSKGIKCLLCQLHYD